MQRDWDVLEDDTNGGSVEYVGVVENGNGNGVEKTARRSSLKVRQPAGRKAGKKSNSKAKVGSPGNIEFQIPSGSYLSLNREAQASLQKSPEQEVSGQRVRRITPGTYVMFSETNEVPIAKQGVGDLWDDILGTQREQVVEAEARTAATGGGFDWGELITGVLETGREVTGIALTASQKKKQRELEARQHATQMEAEREVRNIAAQEVRLSHQARMAEIASEGEALRAQMEAQRAATAASSTVPQVITAAPAVSPAVLIGLGLGGMAVIGTVVVLLARK
jgi:hypothetical protein